MKKDLKILVVASPWLGGSGTVGFELAKHLSHEHRVYFLSYDFPFRGRKEKNDHFLFFNMAPATYALFPYPLYVTSLAERIVNIVKKYDIDMIHAHYGIVFGEAAITAKKILEGQGKKIKIVITFHGTDIIGLDPDTPGKNAFTSVNQWLMQESDVITVASLFMKKFILSSYTVPERKLVVIPNFYDDSVFRNMRNTKRNYIIHVSNFRKVKRPLEVVKAFQILRAKNVRLKLVFVGDGPEKESVKKYIAKHHIPNVIIFSGKSQSEIAGLLNKSAACVLASSFENAPMIAIESLACGTPVVAVDVGGVGEIVHDGKSGFLVPRQRHPSGDLARKLHELLSGGEWEKISEYAAHEARDYRLEDVGKRYVALYRRITKK